MATRTVQDFVEDQVSDCKSFKQICMIAFSTRWRHQTTKGEIEKEYRELRDRRKQISNQNRKDGK